MIDFWNVHGWFFIVFLCMFPRLTMFLTGIFGAWFSPLFFIGWLFAPRVTVAILATACYWHTNPVLCIITWIWALSGESAEKKAVSKRKS